MDEENNKFDWWFWIVLIIIGILAVNYNPN